MENKETNMKRLKGIIAGCNDAEEMAGIISGIEGAAVLYCAEHCEEEIYYSLNTKKKTKVTIKGMIEYLESEA